MKYKFLLILAILVFFTLYTTHLYTEDIKTRKELFDTNRAMILLYSGQTLTSSDLKQYFKGQTTGYISVAYESGYNENNLEKHVVIFHITPEPAEQYMCHACSPLIGGAIYTKTKDSWAIETKSMIIGWGNAFGEKMSLVRIGKDRHAVMLSISDAHQGYETKYINLIVPYNNKLNVALNVGFIEKPGPGACGEAAPEQKVEIKFDETGNSEYFNISAKIQYNEGPCQQLIANKKTAIYKFVKDRYKLISDSKKGR